MLTNTTNDICSFRRSKQFNFPLFMAAPKIFHRSPLSLHFCCSSPATLLRLRKPGFTSNSKFFLWMPNNSRAFKSINHTNRNAVLCCLLRTTSENDKNEVQKENERPAFDLNLAVVLAGFAFEAYSSPPENLGAREIDAAECQTVFLSETFLREVYDGQLFIKLKKGADFPAMDPWGTSDPYVVIQLDSQIIKSKIKWATKEPIWNEEFTINIKKPPIKNLQIAAWDANLVTPHKRMGNAAVSLESLCNGELHELQVELGGMGGGGKVYLEVKYKSFEEIDAEKQGWRIPFVLDFLTANNFGSALKMVLGSERIQARQFVESAFGHMRSLGSTYLPKNLFSEIDNQDMVGHEKSLSAPGDSNWHPPERSPEGSADNSNCIERNTLANFETETDVKGIGDTLVVNRTPDESKQSDDCFWKQITEVINKKVEGFGIQNLGFSIPEEVMWDGLDLLNKIGLQSRRAAEAEYVESGLATPKSITDGVAVEPTSASQELQSSPVDIEKASGDVLRQMDAIFGGLMVLTAAFSQQKGETNSKGKDGTLDASRLDVDGLTKSSVNEKEDINMEGVKFDQSQAEEMKALFLTAESAMEAWAMLATALGRPSFIQSEFEKICFLDNVSTDTQVAIWRDSVQKRLVIAFRGTEQVRWKDLRTDLMLAPTGLNPERLGGDFKEEVQVHSGFLGAYDSVRNRIMSFIKTSIGFVEDSMEILPTWHVYVTGHSLGGALATLLALELSSSQMAKNGMISVTMYNFGSPRVGNKRFVEAYNEKVKDSWRIVNHRDIIPTVPRLMGYCHVAQPVYLSTGNLQDALVNMELLEDGYQGDVIGESTPDVLVSEFMKGEKQLIEQILQTEINLFRSIRDGSALMQHMEDFYYITLLESVRAHYRTSNNSSSKSENKILTA